MTLFFGEKQKNFKIGEIRKYDEEKEYFEKNKNVYIFLKAYLTKFEGGKYAGGNRPSSFKFLNGSYKFVINSRILRLLTNDELYLRLKSCQ